MAHVITITGPSGAGKSTTLQYLLEHEDDHFKPVMTSKYATRPEHAGARGEVICVDAIPPTCDLVYEQYGERYGLKLETILDHLVQGRSPVVILNDIRAVEDVRNYWGGMVRSLFIFRRSPSREQYHQLAELRQVNTEEESPEVRYQKAKALYRIYIENIHLFDHVILNSGTFDELRDQVHQIVLGLRQDPNWPLS
jgi:guanylate kinase